MVSLLLVYLGRVEVSWLIPRALLHGSYRDHSVTMGPEDYFQCQFEARELLVTFLLHDEPRRHYVILIHLHCCI